MDLPPGIREKIEGSLGLQISAINDMQLKLIASEDARRRLQDQVFHLEGRLRDATRQIEHYRAAKKPKPVKRLMKNPNKPMRPGSAFFIFMEEFVKSFNEKNPNNRSRAVVSKAGGGKWKTMSEAEKAPYVAKAIELKSEYNDKMNAYNEKWKTMSEAEKAPYVYKAIELKSVYNDKMKAYNKMQSEPCKMPADDDEEDNDEEWQDEEDDYFE